MHSHTGTLRYLSAINMSEAGLCVWCVKIHLAPHINSIESHYHPFTADEIAVVSLMREPIRKTNAIKMRWGLECAAQRSTLGCLTKEMPALISFWFWKPCSHAKDTWVPPGAFVDLGSSLMLSYLFSGMKFLLILFLKMQLEGKTEFPITFHSVFPHDIKMKNYSTVMS